MNLIKKLKFRTMRAIHQDLLRNGIAKIQARRIGKEIFVGDSIFSSNSKEILREVEKKGYYNFKERLPEKTIEEIIRRTKKLPCYDPYNKIEEFTIENIPDKTNVVNFYPEDLAEIPEIVNLANDPIILNSVSDFLGCTPTLSNINMWWSVACKKAKDAQNFHRDVDDYKFIKLFIYLTDVDLESGPHVYVESSSKSNKFRQIARFSDDKIEKYFGVDQIKYFTGNKGSMFLVDTYGIHKGLPPIGKERLLLQFEYSINPLNRTYKPISSLKPGNTYVNRLFIK